MTAISEIDKQIDMIHRELHRREKIKFLSAESYQNAWDAHPDLRAKEQELYRQRGLAQRDRDQREYDAAMARARVERREASKETRERAAAMRQAEALFPVGSKFRHARGAGTVYTVDRVYLWHGPRVVGWYQHAPNQRVGIDLPPSELEAA